MPVIAPHVTSIPLSNVTYNSVITGGRDISTQSYDLIAKGMCWSNSDPYFSLATCDVSINLGSSMDDFPVEVVGLNPHTQYYMSPWIQTTDGSSYLAAESQIFMTLDASPAPKIVSGGSGTGKRSVYNGKSVLFTPPLPKAIVFSMDASFNDLFPMNFSGTGDIFINYMDGTGLREKSLPYYGPGDSSVRGTTNVRIDASGADFSGMTEFNLTDLSINSLTLPNGMTLMDSMLFSYNHLTNIILPAGLTSLTRVFLDHNQLTSITIPSDIGASGNLQLDLNSNNLSSINLPNAQGFEEINLENNNLSSVVVPLSSGLTFFNAAFNPLTSITIPENLSLFQTLYLFGTLLTSLTIPEGLSSLNAIYTYDCSLLASVTIPSSIKAHQWFMDFRNCAFPETWVNDFLVFLDTVPRPLSSSQILITGGTSAAPTGAGITAKNHLNSIGISVDTN